ncbi:DNA methyltransferase, partial [Planctomycetota bacterium]
MPKAYKPPKLDSPPVYTTAANTSIAEFVGRRRSRRRKKRGEAPGDIVASKTSASYRAHTYHTKVPPEGITPFIERYSHPGDVVLDPFCGSGMTGVAALSAGRRPVLIDLSPAATFIAANYCARPDPECLRREAEAVLDAVRPELDPLYATRCRGCGEPAAIRYTVWSERCGCPECNEEFALWDVAREKRRVKGVVACPNCGREGARGKWQLLEPVPVLVKYRCRACGMQEAPPEEADIETARLADSGGWERRLAYPRTPIPKRGDEIARVHNQGISRVDQLFTRRNLRAVAALWHAIATFPDLECRQQLFFVLTGSMPRASRTNKYIPALRIAPGPILGTMYIPGFHPELNVLSLFARKLKDAARYFESVVAVDPEQAVRISTQSAADLGNIPDGSIDY